MRVVIGILLALALAGCQQVSQAKVDAAVDNTVPVVCAGIDVAWLSWQAAGVKVEAKLSNKINAAYISAKGVCLNPPENSVEALAAALNVYRDFKAALKAAQNGNTAGAAGAT